MWTSCLQDEIIANEQKRIQKIISFAGALVRYLFSVFTAEIGRNDLNETFLCELFEFFKIELNA